MLETSTSLWFSLVSAHVEQLFAGSETGLEEGNQVRGHGCRLLASGFDLGPPTELHQHIVQETQVIRPDGLIIIEIWRLQTDPPSPSLQSLLKIGPSVNSDCRKRGDNSSITILNRSGLTDSKLSLDLMRRRSDHRRMIKQPYTFYVERHDPQRNMARYYAMEIVPDLFGQPCLTRRWGRIGKRGQRKQHQFADENEAVVLFLEIMQKKLRRGYRTPCVPKAVAALMQSPIADPTEPCEQGFRRTRAKGSHLNRDSAATTAKGARSR